MGALTDQKIKELLKYRNMDYLINTFLPDLHTEPPYRNSVRQGLIAEDRTTHRLVTSKGFVMDPEPEPDQIQPSSIELRVGNELYVLNAGFTRFNLLALHRHAINKIRIPEEGYVCNPSYIYVVKSHEKVRLPELFEGETDAKSTTGRVGCMCHAFSEKFGVLEPGVPTREPDHFYFVVEPFAFPILLKPAQTRLFQMRLRERDSSHLTRGQIKAHYGSELVSVYQDNKLLRLEKILEQDCLKLTLSTEKVYAHKRGASKPLDLTKTDFYKPEDYFDEIEGNEELFMEKDRLYLLGTKERVKLGNLCGRLSREATGLGVGLLSHFAGFFDPGFNGEITLEFWSFRPWRIQDGQYCGKVELEELCGGIENPYRGSYQGQKAPRLPKIFKA
ncbi:MAG: 2'-deoxycytidine 5'-triphosphate deaminase [archaeon]